MAGGKAEAVRRFLFPALLAGVTALAPAALAKAPPLPVKVKMSIDETPIVPLLAKSLGFLALEGVEIQPVSIESFAPNDFEMQKPMREGRIDVAYHWFNHAVFGARHGLPITAVMVFNDAPGMTVLVENSKLVTIRSPADFGGKVIASGAGYGTKSLITHALAARHGSGSTAYRSVFTATQGREAGIMGGLKDRTVDVVVSEEPFTGTVRASGLATPLIDLTSGASTRAALGAPWPAQSLLMSPTFLRKNPKAAQRVVNAFVRTMRWINTHSAEEIAARLPESYFAGHDRAARIAQLRATLPGFARGDYRLSPQGATLVIDAISAYPFDASASGKWRSGAVVARVKPQVTYDNSLVERAMGRIR